MACALTQSPGGELAQPPAMALAARNGMLERIKDTHKTWLAVIHAARRDWEDWRRREIDAATREDKS
jgi:hypothetical protein